MDLDRTTLAQLRILVAVARSDGSLDPSERRSLLELPGADEALLDQLVAEEVDVDYELELLSDEERRRLYQSAFAVAYADGRAAMGEVSLLERIQPDEGEASLLDQVFGETVDTVLPGTISPVLDPARRHEEILSDVLKYATISAVAGAMPLPGLGVLADLAVVAIQAKMIHDVGQYTGHTVDRRAIAGFMGGVAGSTGLRIAVNNLARFVPGWGSAFGAATSFASTWALGVVAERWFEAGRELDRTELRDLFQQARREGRQKYEHHQAEVEAAQTAQGRALEALAHRLQRGEITRAQYEAAVASLHV